MPMNYLIEDDDIDNWTPTESNFAIAIQTLVLWPKKLVLTISTIGRTLRENVFRYILPPCCDVQERKWRIKSVVLDLIGMLKSLLLPSQVGFVKESLKKQNS